MNRTLTRVIGALLLEPVKEKYAPHWIPDTEVEKRTRSGGLAYTDSFPRVVKLLSGDGGNGKEKVVASKSLLSRKGRDGDGDGPDSTGFRVGQIKRSPGFNGIVGSRMVKISESGKRRPEEEETIAAPPVEAVAKVKPPLLKTDVTARGGERPVLNFISAVDMVEKMVGERKEISTTAMEDDA